MLEFIHKAQEDTWQFWDKKNGGFRVSLTEPTVAPAPTAECVLALYAADQIVKDNLLTKNKNKILNYLLNTRWTDAGGYYENIMAYSFSMRALKKLGCNPKNKRIKQGLLFLRKHQNKDGGWPFLKGESSHPFFTFLALDALLEYYNSTYEENVKDCFNYFKRLILEEREKYKNLPSSLARCLLGIKKAAKTLKCLKISDKLKDGIEESLKNIKLIQKEDGTWNSEPLPVSLAKFRMNIFTVETARFLLEMDDSPFDKTYGKTLNWIKHNKRKIGWSSDVEKSEDGFSWATAMTLQTLCEFYKRSNDINTILKFFTLEEKPTSFVAYAKEDEDKAFLLKEFVNELGLPVTGMFNIDTQVGPVNNVLKQLKDSSCLFAIYTKNTEKRPNAWKNVLGEYLAAKITDKIAIILLEEGTEIPSDALYSCTYLKFKQGFFQVIFLEILKELKAKRSLLL